MCAAWGPAMESVCGLADGVVALCCRAMIMQHARLSITSHTHMHVHVESFAISSSPGVIPVGSAARPRSSQLLAGRSPRARLPRSPHVSRLVLPPPRSPWALTLGSLLLSLSPRGLRARTRDPRPASSLTHYGTSGGKSSRAFHVLRGCVQSRAWRPRTCSRSLWWTAPSSVAAHCPPSAWHAPSAPERR